MAHASHLGSSSLGDHLHPTVHQLFMLAEMMMPGIGASYLPVRSRTALNVPAMIFRSVHKDIFFT